MAALVLVDLDSVIESFGSGGTLRPQLPMLVPVLQRLRIVVDDDEGDPAGNPAKPSVVVAVAVTAAVAHRYRLTHRYVQRFASHAARAVPMLRSPPPEAVLAETALLLTVPGVCSAALWRLFVNAASVEGAVAFDRLWLISSDRRLGQSIEQVLGPTWESPRSSFPRPAEAASIASVRSWRGPPLEPRSRAFAKPRDPAAAPPCPPPPAFSAPVRTPGEVLWAGEQPIDVLPGSELYLVAKLVEQGTPTVPALLSQVSLTGTTVRGVARMGELGRNGVAKLKPIGGGDGVELKRGLAPTGRVSGQLEEASIGTGAVTLVSRGGAGSWGRATLRTNLPVPLLEELSETASLSLVWRGGRVDDQAMLARAPYLEPRGDRFDVMFHVDGRVEVPGSQGRPPQAWWYRGGDVTATTNPAPLAGRVPKAQLPGYDPPHLVVNARLTKLHAHGSELVPRSPLPPHTSVQIRKPIRPCTVGYGVLEANDRKKQLGGFGEPSPYVAVIALNERLGERRILCSPIQFFDAVSLHLVAPAISLTEWELLRKLPLLLPVHPDLE